MEEKNIINSLVLGIDLGTSYCCCSVYVNDTIKVIPNQYGNRTTPSYISFTDTQKIIGDVAKNNIYTNTQNTVFDIKRIIGKLYTDKTVQNDKKFFPFEMIGDIDTNRPLICVKYKNKTEKYFPEQLSAMLLEQIKLDAESFLNTNITKAVVTVPAYFNNEQKQSTLMACKIAGLDVLRLINEPTAAALAYGITLDRNNVNKNILVFDFGGGTLDVSVLSISNSCFEVIAASGDTHLGGSDIDNRLMVYCMSEFSKQYKLSESEIQSLLFDVNIQRKLRSVCEDVKKALSTTTCIDINFDSFFNNKNMNIKITRDKLEEICSNIFARCKIPILDALGSINKKESDISDVILIGGSTRIPYVRNMIEHMFARSCVHTDINPDEAVSNGAAIQGSILMKNNEKINDILLIDIVPLSLGVETKNNEMSKIIERNTIIPCSKTKYYSTEIDNQRNVKINVFEGERVSVLDNNLLGSFELQNLPPMKRGEIKINVTFDVSADGIMNVSAVEETTGKSQEIIIEKDKSKLSKEVLDKIIQNARENSMLDYDTKIMFENKNILEKYLYSVKQLLSTIYEPDGNENILFINKILSDTFYWIDNNDITNSDDYKQKYVAIEKEISNAIHNITNNNKEEPTKKKRGRPKKIL